MPTGGRKKKHGENSVQWSVGGVRGGFCFNVVVVFTPTLCSVRARPVLLDFGFCAKGSTCCHAINTCPYDPLASRRRIVWRGEWYDGQ